jgi:hypothetical protein
LRFIAFPATEYDEVFSGYQPGQPFDPADSPRKLHAVTIFLGFFLSTIYKGIFLRYHFYDLHSGIK